ncbi:MAG: pseudouridine synthase [Verrucomicrobiae bacterium]|nr:pseudouridine synthase [Verrucomicrobiae bacterium]
MRINQFLAAAGLGSRRACEEFIRAGKVRVNGRIMTDLATRIDPVADEVQVSNRPIRPHRKVYLAFHKPKGVVCSRDDEEGRKTLYDLLPKGSPPVFSVGRLDLDSEGLIFLTNDGAFANHLMHPRYKVPKIYEVVTKSSPTEKDLARLLKGVMIRIEEGEPMVRARAEKVERFGPGAFQVTLTQGYKRQIRQMFYVIGHPVRSLKRIRIGLVELRDLPKGAVRDLKPEEIRSLMKA